MELDFKWKQKTGQYQLGEYLYIGEVCVAGYGWNSLSQHNPDESKRYVGRVYLPDKKAIAHYDKEPEGVKLKIEASVSIWFDKALRKG